MTPSRMQRAMVLLVFLAIGCGGGRQEATAEAPAAVPAPAAPTGTTGTATITGTVLLEGAPPAAAKVAMDADPVCQMQHGGGQMTEEVVVTNGKLQNVFVYVKAGLQGSVPTSATPAKLDQQGCWYTPRIVGVQVNQPLEIINSDGTLHNVNAKPAVNQPFNVAQPVQGMKTTKKFAKPELGISVKCNVHPWMKAYIHVVEHPFFGVTDAAGAFTLQGLPAGTYTLEAWHEKLGTATQEVAVADGQTQRVQLTFKAP